MASSIAAMSVLACAARSMASRSPSATTRAKASAAKRKPLPVGAPTVSIVPLPMPRGMEYTGQRLPASYANFYVANAAVLMPTYDDAADARAASPATVGPGPETRTFTGFGATAATIAAICSGDDAPGA